MLDDIAVLTTACSRPQYLKRSLASWRRARGIFGTHSMVVALGPSDTEHLMLGVIRESMVVTEVYRDGVPGAGLHQAIYDCAQHVFENSDVNYLIFAEEDVIVSTDVLEYFQWARTRFANNPRVLLHCAHSKSGQGWDPHLLLASELEADQSAVYLDSYFNAWCWGISRQNWPVLEQTWEHGLNRSLQRGGYDWNIYHQMQRDGWLASVPEASRSQNIGRYGGVYATEATWKFAYAASFRGSRAPTTYRV